MTHPLTDATARADLVTSAVTRLLEAARTRVPCAPVRDLIGTDDTELAYAVQQELTRRRLSTGAKVVGHKIGLTSPAVQQQLGVDRPDFGLLFADMDVSATVEVPSKRLLQPKAEAEIAFVLGTDLEQGDLDAVQIRDAVDYAVAAIEIVDSRVAAWDITYGDTVADNASSGLFVLGRQRLTLSEFEPRDVVMSVFAGDEQVSQGTGAACLGDPLNALAWLAQTTRDLGEPLRAGQVVLSGALGPMVPTPPGTAIRAVLSSLGEVTAAFSAEER